MTITSYFGEMKLTLISFKVIVFFSASLDCSPSFMLISLLLLEIRSEIRKLKISSSEWVFPTYGKWNTSRIPNLACESLLSFDLKLENAKFTAFIVFQLFKANKQRGDSPLPTTHHQIRVKSLPKALMN